MARKSAGNSGSGKNSSGTSVNPAGSGGKPAKSTAVRNTAIPKGIRASSSMPRSGSVGGTIQPASAGTAIITHEMIARRAYEIYQSGCGGSAFDHWCRAERELRGQ